MQFKKGLQGLSWGYSPVGGLVIILTKDEGRLHSGYIDMDGPDASRVLRATDFPVARLEEAIEILKEEKAKNPNFPMRPPKEDDEG